MKSFWQKLPVPFTILAPMEGVTDIVFREIIAQIGRPDVFFTEFTSCDGLVSIGSEKVAQSLRFSNSQKPVVAQIWGANPETFFLSAKLCKELGFSGIDINMGCPDKSMPKKGACSALINNHSLAKEIILATKDGSGGLPISVKTRLASGDLKSQEWFSFLLEQDLAALTIHLRSVKELSKVPAHWEYMPKIMNLRNKIAPKTFIIGNGDISSYHEVEKKYKLFNCEGYMIGRGVFTNPWIFNKTVDIENLSAIDRLNLYLQHIKLFDSTWGSSKNPANLKKFSKAYINNFPEASVLREKMMLSKNTKEMIEIIKEYRNSLQVK
jgi:tRNA-dihydrouridine synthase